MGGETFSLATLGIIAAVAIINVLFGYWRANTRRFSPQWFMAIHIPVPVSVILRLVFLGWHWFLIPILIVAFAAGQFSGGGFRKLLQKTRVQLSSVLVVDLLKVVSQTFRRTPA